MNILIITVIFISCFSLNVAPSANEPNITCNNYNQHTIIQSIAGKDGVTLKHVAIGRKSACKENIPNLDSNSIPDDGHPLPTACPSSPTHVWTNENSQHVTLNADQSTQLTLMPDEITANGVSLLAQQSLNLSSYSSTSFNFLSTLIQPKMIVGLIAIAYGAIVLKLLYTSHVILQKDDTWAHWRPDVPNSLLAQGDATIAKGLYTDIQARYANKPDTAAFLTPLVYFINDVDAHINQLEQLIKLHATLSKYKIVRIFPPQEKALAQATKHIKRLQILKQFMIKSISHYKVA